MDKNEIYLVVSDVAVNPRLSFGEAIRATTAVASNFKKAYNLALSMGEIPNPDRSYKVALNIVKRDLAVQLSNQSGPGKVTISRIKKW